MLTHTTSVQNPLFLTCINLILCKLVLLLLSVLNCSWNYFPNSITLFPYCLWDKNSSFLEITHSWFDVLPTFLGLSFVPPPQSSWMIHDSLSPPCILVSLPFQVLLPLQGMLPLLFCYLNIIPYSSSLRIMSYSLWKFPQAHICSFYLFHCANIVLCI